MKIGLGTVQFGLDYGISNRGGRTPDDEVVAILEMARRCGISVLDTAPLYGNSEEVVGRALAGAKTFRIVTKTPKFTGLSANDAARLLAKSFVESLQRLGQPAAYGLLVHSAEDLYGPAGPQLFAVLEDLKARGLVRKVGASVYTAAEIDRLMYRYRIDLIQAPVSVLDQRLLHSGHLASLKHAGVEVHARSVFLQGLLLMAPDDLPAPLERARNHLDRYFAGLRVRGLSPLEAALGFVLAIEDIDAVLCGVNNRQQLEQICAVAHCRVDPGEFTQFAITDEAVVNPSLWES
jgi:aryl-alcohol dehydrogenase-like predicted oxidoreductase